MSAFAILFAIGMFTLGWMAKGFFSKMKDKKKEG